VQILEEYIVPGRVSTPRWDRPVTGHSRVKERPANPVFRTNHYILYFFLTFIAINSIEACNMEEERPLPQRHMQYDRRRFLAKSFTFFAGTFLGLNFFSRAEAEERTFYPIARPPWRARPAAASSPRIALIIDDIGSSIPRARDFLALGIPITFSILPQLPYSEFLAGEIDGEGHEIMLHQPMEPYCHEIDPGPGAIFIAYKDPRIEDIVEKNLLQIPQAKGVNNHMGSRFTSCSMKVAQALRIIKQKDLFFVDSLTTAHSKAYQVAKRLHMRTAPRNVFLDDPPDLPDIRFQLRHLVRHALLYGSAIGIGHPHLPTLRALHEFRRDLADRRPELQLVPVSHLV
jgi:uncharacterized protein